MRKSGVALIWSLLTISILLIVTTSMANYIIRESQMSVRIEDSIQAYALAQSGIEWAKLHVASHPDSPNITPSDLGALGDIFESGVPDTRVDVTITKDLATDKVTVISQGLYSGVGRKLQYIISPNAPEKIENGQIGPTPVGYSTDKSYDFSFNLWESSLGPNPIKFGISNNSVSPFPAFGAAGLKTLGVSYDGVDKFTLFAWNGVALVSSTALEGIISDIPAGTYAGTDSAYALKIKVRYLGGTAAQMTISRMSSSTGEYFCNNTASIDLTGMDFSMPAMSGYFVSDKSVSLGTEGDGNVLSYAGGFFDNIFVHGIHGSQYSLVANAAANGSVTGGGLFGGGTNGTAVALPNSGYIFSSWTGSTGCSGTSPNLSIRMDSDKVCTANFVAASVLSGSISRDIGTCLLHFTVSGGTAPYASPSGAILTSGGVLDVAGASHNHTTSHTSNSLCNALTLVFTDALGAQLSLIFPETLYAFEDFDTGETATY